MGTKLWLELRKEDSLDIALPLKKENCVSPNHFLKEFFIFRNSRCKDIER